MLDIRHMLCPTDFSACAGAAFAHAVFLARTHGAQLHVLYVVGPGARDEGRSMDLLYARRLRSAVRRMGGDEGREVRVLTFQERSISAAEGILRHAERYGADLIVMGTHGRRGLRRMVIGSTAEAVVRGAGCPVMTVSGAREAAPAPHVHRILLPVDLSAPSRQALACGRELAVAYGAHLDLLYVAEELSLSKIHGLAPRGEEEAEQTIRRRLEEMVREGGNADVSFDLHVRVDRAAAGILAFTREQKPDLIVIATHGRSGVRRLVMGSVAEAVLRAAQCPVFTVKSFGKSLLPAVPPVARRRPSVERPDEEVPAG